MSDLPPAGVRARNAWSYSNTNYILVGLVLQKATGRSVAELVQQRVIRPLHLANTYVAGTASFRGRFAHGYAPPGLLGDSYVDLSRWSPAGPGPPGHWCPTRRTSHGSTSRCSPVGC